MLLQGVCIKQYTNLQKETLDSALSGCQTSHCRKLHKGNNINFTKCEVLEPRFAHDSAIKDLATIGKQYMLPDHLMTTMFGQKMRFIQTS